jgi:hypothetical protein
VVEGGWLEALKKNGREKAQKSQKAIRIRVFRWSRVPRRGVVKHADRAEADRFFNVPYAAMEEAVINAVYHRSYEIREPIEIRKIRRGKSS